jgi:hypothetical protein
MLTDVAFIPQASHSFGVGGFVFVFGVVVIILVIFVLVYGRGGQSRRRSAHRSRRQTAHRTSRVPGLGGNHEHQAASRRRQNQPLPGKQQLARFVGTASKR